MVLQCPSSLVIYTKCIKCPSSELYESTRSFLTTLNLSIPTRLAHSLQSHTFPVHHLNSTRFNLQRWTNIHFLSHTSRFQISNHLSRTLFNGLSTYKRPTHQVLLERAKESINNSDFDQALAVYQDLLILDPDCANTIGKIGSILLHQGKVKEALPFLKKALEIDPGQLEYLALIGRALIKQERYQDAIDYFDRALKVNHYDRNFILAHKGYALSAIGNVSESLSCLDQVLTEDPDDYGALLFKSIALASNHQLDSSLETLQTLLNISPSDLKVLYLQAMLLFKKGPCYYPKSESIFLQILETNPTHLESLYHLALIYSQYGDFEKSKHCFNQVIQKNARHILSVVHLAKIYIKQDENLEGALKVLDQALEIEPCSLLYKQKILILLQFKKSGVLDACRQAIKDPIAKQDLKLVKFVGDALNQVQEGKWAIHCFDYIFSKDPNDTSILNGLCEALIHCGKYDKAAEINRLTCDYDPENSVVWSLKAWIHCRNGDEKQARQWIKYAEKLDPTSRVLEQVKIEANREINR